VHRSEEPPAQMALGREEPAAAGMFRQPPARFQQPLLEACQEFRVDPEGGMPLSYQTTASGRGWQRAGRPIRRGADLASRWVRSCTYVRRSTLEAAGRKVA
jgi:hypothetical protein